METLTSLKKEGKLQVWLDGLKRLTDGQKLGFLIAGATLLRFCLAFTGLGVDESYTVATSRELHLSVFDHPPMAWWLSWLIQEILQSNSPCIVRLPFIILSGIATWQINRLTAYFYGAQAGLFAALAFVCAPALGITSGTYVLPDGPLIVGLLAAAICLARVLFDPEPKKTFWLLAGFWGGFALLSKYHGIFLFLGTGLFVLSNSQARPWLRSIWPYWGGLIGLIVFSPVLVWNFEHHWISFAFQGGRASQSHLHLIRLFQTLLGQALFLTPWLWCALIVVIMNGLKAGAKDKRLWFLLCLGVPQILLFTLASVGASTPTLYHWAMPGYLFMLPLLGDWLASKRGNHERLVVRGAIVSGIVTGCLVIGSVLLWYVPSVIKAAGISDDPYINVRSLEGFNGYLQDQGLLEETGLIIAPTKWHAVGQFDYALKGRMKATCFCEDAREYGIIAPLAGMKGMNFIIPVKIKDAESSQNGFAQLFGHVERLQDFTIGEKNLNSETFAIFYAKDLKKLPFQAE